jgi:hypothetical protein
MTYSDTVDRIRNERIITEMVNNVNRIELKEILDSLLDHVNRFSFVIRHKDSITREERKVVDIFQPFEVERKETYEWPGTKLLGKNKALVFYYYFNQNTYTLLLQECKSLYDWLHPNRPEDLCFYIDELPVFASIAHEQDSFFLDDSLGQRNDDLWKDKTAFGII